MLKKAATRKKPEEGSIKKISKTGQACYRGQLQEGSQ
jgi:hypothetical protein